MSVSPLGSLRISHAAHGSRPSSPPPTEYTEFWFDTSGHSPITYPYSVSLQNSARHPLSYLLCRFVFIVVVVILVIVTDVLIVIVDGVHVIIATLFSSYFAIVIVVFVIVVVFVTVVVVFVIVVVIASRMCT